MTSPRTTTPKSTSMPTSAIQVNAVAPGLFSISASGSGIGAITALRVAVDGSRSPVDVFRFDTTLQEFVAAPIDLGTDSDQVFLSLFGTGIQGVGALDQLSATVGGQAVLVLGSAPSSQFVGLDQVNIGPLPRSLVGSGEVEIVLTVAGIQTNAVTVTIQ